MARMNILSNILAYLLIFFMGFPLTNCLTRTPNEIKDLEANDGTFASEANLWTSFPSLVSGSTIYSTCGGTYLLGGYNVLYSYGGSQASANAYFRRVYTDLAPHTMIYFTFSFWAIDSWDFPSDGFELSFNGRTINGFSMDLNTFTVNLCGNGSPYNEQITQVYGRVQHSANTLDFIIYSRFDEPSDNEALGIRDIAFLMSNVPVVSDTLCATGVTNSAYYCPGNCPIGQYNAGGCQPCNTLCKSCFGPGTDQCYECNESQGAIWDSYKCVKCDSSCATCSGSGPDQCLSCTLSFYFVAEARRCIPSCPYPLLTTSSSPLTCDFRCPANQYLYPDQTCQIECYFPAQPVTTSTDLGLIRECKTPCAPTEYLYWDGICRSYCSNPPLVVQTFHGITYCNTTCNSTQVIYWNGTCGTSCDFPLNYTTSYSRAFCEHLCPTGSAYLYNNGSCEPTCRQYFISYSDSFPKYFCNYPCQSNQYLYNNGSCAITCDQYYNSYTLWTDKHCEFPCSTSEHLYSNGSCISTCDTRFNFQTNNVSDKFCNYPCLPNQYLYSNGSCLDSCDGLFKTYFLANEKYCDYPCKATEYLYNNGSCLPSCSPLFLPSTITNTYNTITYTQNFCNYPCLPSYYLYSNGSCLLSCQPHFIPKIYSFNLFCDYPCASGQYLYHNGSCLSSCPSIFISYSVGADKFCSYPCKENGYLYQNGSCLGSCSLPYLLISYGNHKLCNFTCGSGLFLYQNGSCQSTCHPHYKPVAYGSELFCNYPCQIHQYLYYNGSCLSSCKLPYVHKVLDNHNFCQYPCTTITEFIYWNGSCLPTCSLPLQQYIEPSSNFCVYPCSLNQYLYWNGSCLDKCPFPFSSVKRGGVKYCEYPCLSSEYLAWDGSCITSCALPFRIQKKETTVSLCLLPCDDIEQYYHENTKQCQKSCDGVSSLEKKLYLKCSPSKPLQTFIDLISTPPVEPNSITVSTVAKTIQYVRYLSIKLPPNLERLVQTKGIPILSLMYGNKASSDLSQQRILALEIEKYRENQSFLMNFWPEMASIIILLICVSLFKGFEAILMRLKLEALQIIFQRLIVLLRWNILLILFANILDDVILYSAIEFKNFNLDSPTSIFSFLTCLIMILVEVVFLVGIFAIAPQAHKAQTAAVKNHSCKEYSDFLSKWESVQVLYRGYRDSSDKTKLSHLFFFLYTIRMGLPMFLTAYISDPPLLLTILYTLINITALIYLLYVKPLRKKVNLIQLVLLEIILLIINVGYLILTIFDLQDEDHTEASINVGDMIIVCNFILVLLPVIFLAIKLSIGILAALRLQKTSPSKAKALWVQLLYLPIQQAGMGFEQVQIAPFLGDYNTVDDQHSSKSDNSKKSNYKYPVPELLSRKVSQEGSPNLKGIVRRQENLMTQNSRVNTDFESYALEEYGISPLVENISSRTIMSIGQPSLGNPTSDDNFSLKRRRKEYVRTNSAKLSWRGE